MSESSELSSLISEARSLISEMKQMRDSRRGLPGASIKGEPGRDAVVRVVQQDGKIRVFAQDNPVCEIVAIKGDKGDAGVGIKGDAGRSATPEDIRAVVKEVPELRGERGEAGHTPTASEIVEAFASALKETI